MDAHAAVHYSHSSFRTHLLLGLLLVAGGAVIMYWPAARTAAWVVVVGSVATHVGLALVALLGVRLLWVAHAGRNSSPALGQTIRWARFYDLLVKVLLFGRERAFRETTLERAQVSAGEHVLDVGCGTGTLALAAKRRVGSTGMVHGVDAAAEMVARAKQKAAREGLEVTFDVAPAQALPFSDRTFDVVLSTLTLHHLSADARKRAVAEMRRVLKPGGRLLVVDFAKEGGLLAALDPVGLVHGHDQMHVAHEAEALMRDAGFRDIVSGKLGSGVLGYALGRVDERDHV